MSQIDGRQVRRHFSASASTYDAHAAVQQRVALKVADLVAEEAPASGIFLEVGTGTGFLAEQLCRQRSDMQAVLSDLAHPMTLRARQRLAGAPAVDAAAEALPLAGGSVTLVCSTSAYQWVENLSAAFAESRRILRPGGVFVFALFGRRTLWELKDSYRDVVLQETERYPGHLHRLPSRQTVAASLDEAGFAHGRVWEEDEVEQHASLVDLLRSIKGVGAHNASSNRPRGLVSRGFMRRLADTYAARFSDRGSLRATYHVIYGVGRVA